MLKKSASGSFLSHLIEMVSGNALAQVILMASSPILTRLFLPEAFGIAATFLAIVAVLSIGACLRYELAIVIPKRDEEAATLFNGCLLLSILSGLICLCLIATILLLGKMPPLLQSLGTYIWLVPAAVCLYGFHQAINYWNVRRKRFRIVSMGKVLTQLTTTASTLGAGAIGYTSHPTLIIGNFAGHCANLYFLLSRISGADRRLFENALRSGEYRPTFLRFRKFPIYSLPSGLINTTASLLPILAFGHFFSPAIVGLYAFTVRFLQAPITLVGTGISQVLTQRVSTAEEPDQVSNIVRHVFLALFSLALFPSIYLAFFGDDLFAVVFGERWRMAGLYAQLASPWILVWFIASPLSILFEVLEEQRAGTVAQSVILAARIIALCIGVLSQSASITVLLLSVFGFIAFFFMLYKIFRIAGVDLKQLLGEVLLWLLAASLLASLLLLLDFLPLDKIPLLLFAGTLTVASMLTGLLRSTSIRFLYSQ